MKNLIVLICLVAFFSFSPGSVFGCSTITVPPSKFDSNEFIFVGKVIGYTKTVEPDIPGKLGKRLLEKSPISEETRKKQAELKKKWGTPAIILEVETVFHLPETPKNTLNITL